MLEVSPGIRIDEAELSESFIRASGPGGQNVNKVATAVQLRFDLAGNRSIPDDVKQRLARLAGRRLTDDGVLIIEARRFRTQERNREDARERLAALIRQAEVPPKPRKATKPSRAAKRRRMDEKTRRGAIKSGRGKVSWD